MIYTIVRKDEDDVVDAVISFDSITSFDEDWSATVSTQTVERGFNITDHVTIDPEQYSINAVISSYSLFDLDGEIVWNGEEFTSTKPKDVNSHVKARDEIISIFKSASIITLVESSVNAKEDSYEDTYNLLKSGYFREIEPCVITSLSISHPSAGSGAFFISMKVQKIYVAEVVRNNIEKATRALIPLTPSASSSVGSKSGESDIEVSDIDNLGDLEGLPKPTKTEGGLDWFEEKARVDETVALHKSNEEQLRRMNDISQATGKQCAYQMRSGRVVFYCAELGN